MENTSEAFDYFVNKCVLFNILWHKIKLKINRVKYMLWQIYKIWEKIVF